MKLYVQLGRAGDILNILPMLWKDAQCKSGPDDKAMRFDSPSKLMVAAEYAPLLEGVSYVEPVIYDGPHYELDKAVEQAKLLVSRSALSHHVLVTQFNGAQARMDTATRASRPAGQATSFQKDAWRVAGQLKNWDECWPLVFDRRDKAREAAMLKKCAITGKRGEKPLLLLALEGKSSPFPYADLLRELVTLKFGATHRVLELPQAERIYDLLALYEKARLLIAIDSAPLHLAWACRTLPVFALAQDKPWPWHGSSWRPNHVWYCRYHDWPVRAMEMIQAISEFRSAKDAYPDLTVWSEYNTHRKFAVAQCWLPIMRGMCARDSANVLKDAEKHPYLKDVLRMAIQRAPADSMPINLTRPFVTIRHGARYKPKPPFYAYRLVEPNPGETGIAGGQYQPITDLFCATRKWWKEVLPEIPDLVLNNDYTWSECLRVLFQQRGVRDETGVCFFGKEPV